ncbi:MAG TPA: hypothetical protein O0W88_03710 [Methanocorpusculum sp.]|nr:hypothetical protein [Methanocorpusculum sp.]HJK01046.1 hypothetical protein [Methanocorpusculum sp.]HJK02238.1 hypothetical protein [Methanocorpusculum sp.]
MDLALPEESITNVFSEDVVMRSLTKSFSIPGVQFSYPNLIMWIETACPPLAISAVAKYYAKRAFIQYL